MKTATITKSIRLSPDESQELARLSEYHAQSEAALMKKWIHDGIRKEKLELALQAYQQRKVDLRTGAIMARLPYNQFMHEVEAHNIVILDDHGFLERLAMLADAFQNERLRAAVQAMRAEEQLA
jgi:predicted HTH domain antitoxin